MNKANTEIKFTGKSILICEDDDSSFLYLRQILSSRDTKISHVKNGLEAVNFCKSGTFPDIILMDIKMPLMDGIEATQILKSNKQFKVPIVAQTAYATSHEIRMYSGYFDAFITKPIMKDELIKCLNSFLCPSE